MATTVKIRKCRGCGAEIPAERLDALPRTPWCVCCAEERVERVGGNMVYSHKTAPTLELKPIGEAERFAALTRRSGPGVTVSLWKPV